MKKTYLILSLLVGILQPNLSFTQILFPGGTSCDSAVPIPVGDLFMTSDADPFGGDHWYKFIAPCDGELSIGHTEVYFSVKTIYSGECMDLTMEAFGPSEIPIISHSLLSGESVYIVINDTIEGVVWFDVDFTGCDEIDSVLLDIQGTVFYDLNDNGIRDLEEVAKNDNIIQSTPYGVFSLTDEEGFYYSSLMALSDGVYELAPQLGEHWKISTDSLVYTLNVNDSYVQRDSLNFGIAPDTLIYDLNTELIVGFPRCNDTINIWIDVQNIGTTLATGLIHLVLDDSLDYITADILPDSIVGQNLYWNFEDLFFDEHILMNIHVGTPDGIEDTLLNNLMTSLVEGDEEMFSSSEISNLEVVCAYDPNDKTAEPIGEGEFHYIPTSTEYIEYLIRFQNTGTDTAINVKIRDPLDADLNWNSLELISYSHDVQVEMNLFGEVWFNFEDIMLPDSNVNELGSQGFVKFRIHLNPGMPEGTYIFNLAHIFFDLNPFITTNTAFHILDNGNLTIHEAVKSQELLVYPNPFTETTTVYFGEDLTNHSIQIVDITGKVVYSNTTLTVNKIEIEASLLKEGMYILLLIENESNQVISNAKLMVK
jgi:uncharacterized repeat protein (TIGR01451 family)